MGQFFSNIHLRKNDKADAGKLMEYYHEVMLQKGYQKVESEDDADLTLAVYDQGGQWISVAADIIEFSSAENMAETCRSLSEQFDTDVMAFCCVDSDALLMQCSNTRKGTDAWAKAGYCPGISKRSRPASWKGIVTDYQQFKEALSDHDSIAEDVLETVEPLLGLLPEQGSFRYDLSEEYPGTLLAYYKAPEDEKKENPSLAIGIYSLNECTMNSKYNVVCAVNRGGSSKGLGIAFSGPYVEKEEICFRDVQLEYGYDGGPASKFIPLELTKIKDKELGWIYYAEVPQFKIPGKADMSLPDMRYIDEESRRSFGVRFTPEGNERMAGDICVHFIPLKYPKGQCWWCATKNNREEFRKEFENHMQRELLRRGKKNASVKDVMTLLKDILTGKI